MTTFHFDWSTIGLFFGCLGALAAAVVIPFWTAREADRTGELRIRVRGLLGEQVVRRNEEPERFATELKFLRAVPWIGLTAASLGILFLGVFA